MSMASEYDKVMTQLQTSPWQHDEEVLLLQHNHKPVNDIIGMSMGYDLCVITIYVPYKCYFDCVFLTHLSVKLSIICDLCVITFFVSY